MLSDADISHIKKALCNLEFLVVQDIFPTETTALAHVVLPATSFAEKDGTFTNTERRVQVVRQAIEPVSGSQPDWSIACQIARRMGASGFDFKNPQEILDEINRVTPSYGGISYERLETCGSLQWPCPTTDHPGTPILHTQKFTRGRGKFIPLVYRPPFEIPDAEYPLMLNTGRSLFHFHTGTMTRRVKGLNAFMSEEKLQINQTDAQKLGVCDGDLVSITSRRGHVAAKAMITDITAPGSVFMTFHFRETPTNSLTNPAIDPVAKTPEYKTCAVRVDKIS
jgi:predicted molibdopterin-dependent oxidoreductase YjgC